MCFMSPISWNSAYSPMSALTLSQVLLGPGLLHLAQRPGKAARVDVGGGVQAPEKSPAHVAMPAFLASTGRRLGQPILAAAHHVHASTDPVLRSPHTNGGSRGQST